MQIKTAEIEYTRCLQTSRNALNEMYGVPRDLVNDTVKTKITVEIQPNENYEEVISKLYNRLKQFMDRL